MAGVAVGKVLNEDWNIPDRHIGQYRYTHKSEPYVIELKGYKVTLFDHSTTEHITESKDTEFEVLQVLMKMGSLPEAVLNEEIEL